MTTASADRRPARRRVLFLIPTLAGGGAERVVVTLLRHLDRRHFDLTLGVVDTQGAVYLDAVPDHVRLIDLKSRRVRHALPRIMRLIWNERPDVVFSTLGHLNLALAAARPLLPNTTRYVARETIVVSEVIDHHAWPRVWAWAYRRFYRRFDRVVCQSQDMQTDLVQRHGMDPALTTIIHNPVDLAAIAAAARETRSASGQPPGNGAQASGSGLRLVTAGRLVPQKGFDLLIEALALLRDRDMRLTLLGDGPQRAELQQLANARGVAGAVEFVGFQRNPYAYFARADAFVLSSRFEGFPNAALEALACGTPVVALPAPGGVHELLDGIDGCVVAETMSAPSLAEALTRVRKVRVPASAIERFDAGRIAEQYAAELDRGPGRALSNA